MHEPVLLDEVIELLSPVEGGTYIDGTLGRGGHSRGILECIGPEGCLIGIDRDNDALERASARLQDMPGRKVLVHGTYAEMGRLAAENGIEVVDGILMDLGVSSEQIDIAERGFSFMKDGPLDMRMDQTEGETAADLVARATERELIDIIRRFGEEPSARRIAKVIVSARQEAPIMRTGELAGIIESELGRRGRIHPATKTFQALRMQVNRELDLLSEALEKGINLLRPGGRMAVISFHSLEDRMVKQAFARHAGRMVSLQQGGEEWEGVLPMVKKITRKPVVPGVEETERNPRARSSKLRVVEKVK